MDPLLIEVPDTLTGPRVELKAYRVEDAEVIRAAMVDSRESLRRIFTDDQIDRSLEDRRAGLRRGLAARIHRTEFGYGIWSHDEHFLGDIGIYGPDWKLGRFEIGYWIHTRETGKGYVTEAAHLLCDLCFGPFNAKKVTIQCDADNLPSAGIPQRLGFALEGTLRHNMRGPDSRLRDTLVFGMTDDMWRIRAD
jgi:RimJ/RimL family protein N-acetyltransferase